MTTVVSGETYYSFPAFLVVDAAGTPVADATSSSILTPGGDSVTLLQPGTLAALGSLTANADGVVGAYLASAPQLALAFGSVSQVQTTDEVEALAASAGLRGFVASVGDGSSTTYLLTHGLGTTDVVVQAYRVSTGETVLCPVVRTSADSVTIGFGSVAPALNSMRVMIHTVPNTTFTV